MIETIAPTGARTASFVYADFYRSVSGQPTPFVEFLPQLLSSTPELHCAGAFSTMDSARAALPALRPDVLVIDPGRNGQSDDAGYELIEHIRAALPDTRIVIFSLRPGFEAVSRARAAGASAFIGKNCLPADIVEVVALVAASSGGTFVNHQARG